MTENAVNSPPPVVIGDGYIGSALAAAFRRRHPHAVLTSRQGGTYRLDLAEADPDVSALVDLGCRQAVIAAGISKMAACEADPRGTQRVNVDGTLKVADKLSRAGITVVWLSSDQVFDGSETSYPDQAEHAPINEYGRQKAEVERALPEICGANSLILRLGKVYGVSPGDRTLVDEMLRLLSSGQEVRAARDQIFNTVRIDDLTASVLDLLDLEIRGTCNLCAPEAFSRLDIALACARALNVSESLVRPILLADLHEGFARPKRVVLDPVRVSRLLSRRFANIIRSTAELAGAYTMLVCHG